MNKVTELLWIIAISMIIVNSIYFTIVLKFPQLKLKNVFKSLKKEKNKENISPKDTLIMTLSSKIGVGSLSGISLCIYYGGIGTIFWIWISTFFLSIITYIENNLSIIYKEKDGKYTKSGPSYYIKKGLKNKKLSILYSILIIITYAIFFSSIQNNTITTLSTEILNIEKIVITIAITILSSVIILKGIKTISNFCNKIFPVMMIIYIIISLIIIVSNINYIPNLLINIIKEGLKPSSISPGIISSIIMAFQKSIFANESGVGTSAIISGTTNNNNHKLQGNIGIIQTYFINFIVLTLTAIVISLTKYNDLNIINGIELTKYAYYYHLKSFGEYMLLLILFLFSFSTIITIYYYGENSLKSITKNQKLVHILRIITISSIFIGGIITAKIIWKFIDFLLSILTIINMYSIYKLKDIIIEKHKE